MLRLRVISLFALAASTSMLAAHAEGDRAERLPPAGAALATASPELEARGPRAIFETVEAAAVDALTYAHLQALAARKTDRVRGGTIHRLGQGYSYGEIHVAGPLAPHRVSHTLEPRDVARFLVYPRIGKHEVDRANERPSAADRRSVSTVDPLHRPLYILHPSLAIRVYRGEDRRFEEVTKLRRPKRLLFVAGN